MCLPRSTASRAPRRGEAPAHHRLPPTAQAPGGSTAIQAPQGPSGSSLVAPGEEPGPVLSSPRWLRCRTWGPGGPRGRAWAGGGGPAVSWGGHTDTLTPAAAWPRRRRSCAWEGRSSTWTPRRYRPPAPCPGCWAPFPPGTEALAGGGGTGSQQGAPGWSAGELPGQLRPPLPQQP